MNTDSVFGIDLGTTNSVIATLDEHGKPYVIPNAEGETTTPSVVRIEPDGTTVTGAAAKRDIILEDENTAQFFKRDMGTSISYIYRGRPWTPVDLSVEVLQAVKSGAEERLQASVRRAVITVPAYFHDAARVATAEAARRAGLDVLQIINEPTAAAIAYGLKPREDLVLVYDLGGGTFDVTLVRIAPGAIEVVGTDGNHNLGGKDWDDRIADYVCRQFAAEHGFNPLDDAYAFQEVLLRSEEAKKSLSTRISSVIPLKCKGKISRVEITRALLEDISRDLLVQTENLIAKVLEETDTPYDRVGTLVMVGGSSRMPACRDLVRRLFGREPDTSVNPYECVALGAAVQASQYLSLSASGVMWRGRVDDVMSHSLGMIAVSADGQRYVNSVLVPKNKRIPCTETRPFLAHAAKDGEDFVSVYVTQGESEDPAGCSFVGKFVIEKVPHSAKGAVVDITYAYDRSGMVAVSAVARSDARPLPVRKESEVGDMSWVLRPPIRAIGAIQKTIYVAVDLSGSMAGAPLEGAKKAVNSFVSNIDLTHSAVGVVSFADTVCIDREATSNARTLERAVAGWVIGTVGYGNATDPFAELLERLRNADGEKFILVLTDGVWAYQDAAIRRAAACREAGIHIVAIGFGGADREFLKRIATADESALYISAGDLTDTFIGIAQVLVESRDLRLFSKKS